MTRAAVLAVAATLVAACATLGGTKPGPTPSGGGGTNAKPIGLAAIEEKGHAVVEAPPAPALGRFVLEGATVMTAAGTTHRPGWVAVVDGRIAGVGAGAAPADAKKGATVIDLAGRWLTPGLIDAHSHLGVYPTPGMGGNGDGNEATAPTTAGVWAEHSFWAEDPGIERAVRGGVTSILVLPGSANLVGGRGVVMHLRPMRGARAMRFPGAPDVVKMACGENPKRVYQGRGPSTRMGNVRGQREAFIAAAKWLKDNMVKAEADVARDLNHETLAGVLEGRLLAEVHCYTAQDMLDFMQLADEFGFKVRAFHHALEAYKIRDLLKAKDIGVATWADWWGFKLEAWDGIPESAALIAEGGGRVAIHSDSAEGIQRLNQEAGKALASGRARGLNVDEEMALRWVTANPAWMLGIDKEVGTLEVGKRADLVAWTASPFSVYAKADKVWIDGALVMKADDTVPWSDLELGREIAP